MSEFEPGLEPTTDDSPKEPRLEVEFRDDRFITSRTKLEILRDCLIKLFVGSEAAAFRCYSSDAFIIRFGRKSGPNDRAVGFSHDDPLKVAVDSPEGRDQ